MPKRYLPGRTIGIIGSSISSALLAQAAGRLGYRVASLVLDEDNPVKQFANWQTVTEVYDEVALVEFGQKVDVVHSEMELLSITDYQILNEVTDLPLSDDLMTLTTDRILEKVFLDNQKCLVAPYAVVTTLSDIKEAVEYIGFPCVLKSSQRNYYLESDHVVLYSEQDYNQAEEKLKSSSCILESWIPCEKKVSLSVLRNERGELLIYPIVEVLENISGIGKQVRYPAKIDDAVADEINRIGQLIAESLDLTGLLTIKFFITSAGVIYVNELNLGLSDESMFSVKTTSLDHFEGLVRSLVGLPLPQLIVYSQAAISLPLINLNRENVLTQFMLRTDWGFVLYNPIESEPGTLTGYVIVTGESLKACERQIELTELTKLY